MANVAELVVSIGADLKDVKAKLNTLGKDLNNVKKDTGGLNRSFDSLKGAMIGAFSVAAIASFGKAIIDVRSEFEKFEAVLTNTLGSKSAAQIAMASIQDFASKTPFSVAELTDSFVKLANQGFIPTTNQMRQLGDLAASTGKDFNQLAEAVIDAQTGEFERLKEFGIRAQKEGDKVTFTFKGVKQQVDFTNESIQAYVLSLGDAAGVSGSMAAVSQTLGGQISNLGDSWDQFLNTLGGGTSGIMGAAISALNDMLKATTDLIKGTEQLAKEKHLSDVGREAEEIIPRFKELVEWNQKVGQSQKEAYTGAYKQIIDELVTLINLEKERMQVLSDESANSTDLDRLKEIDKLYSAEQSLLEINEARLKALTDYVTKEATSTQEKAKAAAASEKLLGFIGKEEAALKKLEEQRTAAKTELEVSKYNDLIAKQSEYISTLKETTEAEYKATKVRLDGLTAMGAMDTPRMMQPTVTTALPTTWSTEFLSDIQKELDIATNKSLVFGDSFNLAGEKTSILTNALNYLIENGVAPTNANVEMLKAKLGELGQVTIDVSGQLKGLFSELAVGVAESFGQMFAGVQTASGFFDSLLVMVVDFVSSFGKLLISAGVASNIFQTQLMTNPYLAIAAGAAMVALAAVIRTKLKAGPGGGATAFANGGLVYGPTYSLTGEYPGARNNPEVIAPLSKLQDMLPSGKSVEVYGRFELEGTKLVAAVEKQKRKENRVN